MSLALVTSRSSGLLLALVLVVACFGTARAENRLAVEGVEVPVGAEGVEVPLRLSSDQAILGFSVYVEYDPNDLQISEVRLGSGVAPSDPDWADGTIDNARGRLSWAVVFDFEGPSVTKELPPSSDVEALVLVVDVLRSSAGSEVLDLKNVTSSEPRRLNVMTDTDGVSISPSLTDGTISVVDLRPVIDGYANNEGPAGSVFFINGRNFDAPGLSVEVCGAAAEHELLGDGSLSVTAPECGPGAALVEVCTDFGCASDPDGFTYPMPPGAPEIESFLFNQGKAGQEFFVIGQNFDEPGLSVEVCGVAAEFELSADPTTINVVAPACGSSGPVRVRVCTDFGCDLDNAGFVYEEDTTGPVFRRGDTNSDGGVDLSDGVATLGFLFLGAGDPKCLDAADANDSGAVDLGDAIYTFNYLFLGGSDIPPPFESCGSDPTNDSVGCAMSQDTCG